MNIYGLNGTNPAGYSQKMTNLNLPQNNEQTSIGSMLNGTQLNEDGDLLAFEKKQTGPNEQTIYLKPYDTFKNKYIKVNTNDNYQMPVVPDKVVTDNNGRPKFVILTDGNAVIPGEGVTIEAHDGKAIWNRDSYISAEGDASVKTKDITVQSRLCHHTRHYSEARVFSDGNYTAAGQASITDKSNGKNIRIRSYDDGLVIIKPQNKEIKEEKIVRNGIYFNGITGEVISK